MTKYFNFAFFDGYETPSFLTRNDRNQNETILLDESGSVVIGQLFIALVTQISETKNDFDYHKVTLWDQEGKLYKYARMSHTHYSLLLNGYKHQGVKYEGYESHELLLEALEDTDLLGKITYENLAGLARGIVEVSYLSARVK